MYAPRDCRCPKKAALMRGSHATSLMPGVTETQWGLKGQCLLKRPAHVEHRPNRAVQRRRSSGTIALSPISSSDRRLAWLPDKHHAPRIWVHRFSGPEGGNLERGFPSCGRIPTETAHPIVHSSTNFLLRRHCNGPMVKSKSNPSASDLFFYKRAAVIVMHVAEVIRSQRSRLRASLRCESAA
jgi:hypothetical protein